MQLDSSLLDTVQCTDAVSFLKSLPDQCLDSVITDPPYAEISRPYGRLTEAEWWALIVDGVVPEVRRVLKPTGSAVFIIQPNSRKVGSMRGWVFEFMAWVCREWNMVQDAWWWNPSSPPTAHTQERNGLMRVSVKACVWAGDSQCYRDQSAVLWDESSAQAQKRATARYERVATPSGHSMNAGACIATAERRGGVTPFNMLPVHNGNSTDAAGTYGHGAARGTH